MLGFGGLSPPKDRQGEGAEGTGEGGGRRANRCKLWAMGFTSLPLYGPLRCCQVSCRSGVVVGEEVVGLKTLFEWPGAIDSGLRRGTPALTKRPTTLHGKVAFSGRGITLPYYRCTTTRESDL